MARTFAGSSRTANATVLVAQLAQPRVIRICACLTHVVHNQRVRSAQLT